MKTRITWQGQARFEAATDSGHRITIDGPPEGGGENAGARPMELVLAGTAGCSAYDVVSILRKARQAVAGCEVEATAERAPEPPQVFTRIHLHFVVTGENLSEKQVDRAIRLSAEKYCSASIMLAKTAELTHDFELREA